MNGFSMHGIMISCWLCLVPSSFWQQVGNSRNVVIQFLIGGHAHVARCRPDMFFHEDED
jgi:hypothetical protein